MKLREVFKSSKKFKRSSDARVLDASVLLESLSAADLFADDWEVVPEKPERLETEFRIVKFKEFYIPVLADIDGSCHNGVLARFEGERVKITIEVVDEK